VLPNEKSPRRETDAPLCPKCMTRMKLLTLVPGREFNYVHYGCEECGERARRSVPRGR
jgi:tRNA(Ile2) C34 agmatinyltransferase TiaS